MDAVDIASRLSNGMSELFEAQILLLETLTAQERARILLGLNFQALDETDSDGSQTRLNIVLIALASTFRRIESYADITFEFPQSAFNPERTDEGHIDQNLEGEQSVHGENGDATSIDSDQDILCVVPSKRSHSSSQNDRHKRQKTTVHTSNGEHSENGPQYTGTFAEYHEPLRSEGSVPAGVRSRETTLEPATPSAYPISLPSTPKPDDQSDDERFSETEIDQLQETPRLPSDAKPWFKKAFDSISSIDLGPHFRELLRLYIRVESIQNYEESKKRFQKDRRPAELSSWIVSGRWRVKRRPQVKDLDSFTTSWWNWWIDIQPRWRVIDKKRKRPLQGMYGRSWHRLIAPGRNGWLSVVACLYWWGCTIGGEEGNAKTGFEEAVKDTIYMMEGLLFHMKERRMSPEV